MKVRRKLEMTLMILICVTVMLVGFVGIYTKNKNKYANKLPSYQLSSDLKGATLIELDTDTSTDTVYYDSEGKKVDSSTVTDDNKSNYTTSEEKVNPDEVLTEENYEATLKIFKERLKFLKADQYNLDLDKKTGKIVLTFSDDYPDDIESILPMQGKLELIDSNTNDVILDYSGVKSAEATYASTEDGYSVYITLKLNKSGIEKINNIEGYKNSTDDNGEVTTNKFKLEFDGEEIGEISYDDMILSGSNLRVTTASKVTSSSTVNSKLNTATVMSKLTTMGRTPVKYKIAAEEYVNSTVNKNVILGVMIGIAVLLVAISIYFIIKYKVKGLLSIIGTFTNIALFTILIRLTNISISMNSIAGIVGLIIINTYLINNILKELENKDKTFGENIKKAYFNTINVLIISLFIFVVFAFNKMAVISAMGLLMFWGWIIVVLGNLLFTVPMLAIRTKEEK